MATDYLQIWALLCKDEPNLGYLYEVYQELKRSSIQFPPPPRQINKALVKTIAPPEWVDSDDCIRCRVPFTLTVRKHHCRNCGYVFCQDCSSRTSALPEYGIPDEVRICETCHVRRQEAKVNLQKSAPLPVTPPSNDLSEDDSELAQAIKLSLAEKPKDIPAPTHADEEEKMLRAAIEQSLKESNPTHHHVAPVSQSQSQPKPEPQILDAIEKENIKLFGQLVEKLSLSGVFTIQPEIEALAITMESLKITLRAAIQELKPPSPELAGYLASLEVSLTRYQALKQMPPIYPAAPKVAHAPPTSGALHSTTYHAASIPNYPPMMPSYPPTVYGPPQAQPNQVACNPQTQPVEGKLIDDEPLIQL